MDTDHYLPVREGLLSFPIRRSIRRLRWEQSATLKGILSLNRWPTALFSCPQRLLGRLLITRQKEEYWCNALPSWEAKQRRLFYPRT